MKINIEVEQTVQKEIELETTAYYSDGTRYSLITDESIIQIGPTIMITWSIGSSYYESNLNEILEEAEPCAPEYFNKVYQDFISKANEIVLTKEPA